MQQATVFTRNVPSPPGISFALAVFALVILVAIIYPLVKWAGGAGRGYSDGVRTGVIVKLSHKGLIWKSWEGQMLLGGIARGGDGAIVPTSWEFSLPDGPQSTHLVAQLLRKTTSSERTTVKYEQYFIGPINLSTDCVITGIADDATNSPVSATKDRP